MLFPTFVKNGFNIYHKQRRQRYPYVWPQRSSSLLMSTVITACLLVHKREAGERREWESSKSDRLFAESFGQREAD